MSKELKDKLRRKNKIIEEQQLLLDEYRNTINFLQCRQNSGHSANRFIQRIMDTGWILNSEQQQTLLTVWKENI